jgi:ABC-type branched-subunit amino acid transport system ATPase component
VNRPGSLLTVEGLEKDFGGVRAAADLGFRVEAGSITGLIGPNGSGKTTTFNLISGLLRPDRGRILFGPAGRDLVGLTPHAIARQGIGRTFQIQRLFPQLTVLENVLVAAYLRTRSGFPHALVASRRYRQERAEATAVAVESLRLFGTRLLPMRDAPAGALSFANRRRLEIARALATRPSLLLLDEPAAGMNPSESRELMEDIRGVRERGITIFVIEHDMTLVQGLCETVIALDSGEKIAEGTFEEVRSDPRVIEAYLGRGRARPARTGRY